MQKTNERILVGDAVELEADWFSKNELFKDGEKFTLIINNYRLDASSGYISYLEIKEEDRSAHFKLEKTENESLSQKAAFEWVIENDHRFKMKTRDEMKTFFDDQTIGDYYKTEDKDILRLMNSADEELTSNTKNPSRIIVGVNDEMVKRKSIESDASNAISL